jgi:hypothetical protein
MFLHLGLYGDGLAAVAAAAADEQLGALAT